MAISFNPQIKFTSEIATKKSDNSQVATKPAETQTPQAAAAPVKKTPVRNFFANIAYAWVNLSEGAKGVVNGLLAGGIAGTILGAGDWLITGAKRSFAKAGTLNKIEGFGMFTHPKTALSKVGKVWAPVTAAALFLSNMIMARLDANKRTANVDHQLYTGHRDK